jgi:hypothetical protein
MRRVEPTSRRHMLGIPAAADVGCGTAAIDRKDASIDSSPCSFVGVISALAGGLFAPSSREMGQLTFLGVVTALAGAATALLARIGLARPRPRRNAH